MSGLVCLDYSVIDLNRIVLVRPYSKDAEVYLAIGEKVEKFVIAQEDLSKLQKIIKQRSDTQNTLDQLTKENQHLRSVIAAMPGFGDDFKTAKIEFEHVAEK